MLSIYVFLVLLYIKYLCFHKYSRTSTTATFLANSPYTGSCLNLSTMATFSCLQGGRCGEGQLYSESFIDEFLL